MRRSWLYGPNQDPGWKLRPVCRQFCGGIAILNPQWVNMWDHLTSYILALRLCEMMKLNRFLMTLHKTVAAVPMASFGEMAPMFKGY